MKKLLFTIAVLFSSINVYAKNPPPADLLGNALLTSTLAAMDTADYASTYQGELKQLVAICHLAGKVQSLVFEINYHLSNTDLNEKTFKLRSEIETDVRIVENVCNPRNTIEFGKVTENIRSFNAISPKLEELKNLVEAK